MFSVFINCARLYMYYYIALRVDESVILHMNQDHIFSFDIKRKKKKKVFAPAALAITLLLALQTDLMFCEDQIKTK